MLKASLDMNDAVITDMTAQVADNDKSKLMEHGVDYSDKLMLMEHGLDVDVNTIKSQLHSQQVRLN